MIDRVMSALTEISYENHETARKNSVYFIGQIEDWGFCCCFLPRRRRKMLLFFAVKLQFSLWAAAWEIGKTKSCTSLEQTESRLFPIAQYPEVSACSSGTVAQLNNVCLCMCVYTHTHRHTHSIWEDREYMLAVESY